MYKKLIKYFIALDIAIIVLHLTFGWNYGFANLDFEYNLPTFYQGLKALWIGWVLLKTLKFRFIGFVTIGMALDEMFVIHENTETYFRNLMPNVTENILFWVQSLGYQSSTWPVLLSPLFLVIAVFSFRIFLKVNKKEKQILLLTVFLFGIALLAEVMGTTGKVLPNTHHLLVAVEEAAEIFGVTNLLRLKSS